MAVTVVVETGEGIPGANAHEDVTATATRLTDHLGTSTFSGLANPDSQAAFLIRGTKSVDRSLRATSRGRPKVREQGLFYPRGGFYTLDSFQCSFVIPDDVRLASALKAEYLARREDPTETISSLPSLVTKVEFADGVRVEKYPGRMVSTSLEDLQQEINALVNSLSNHSLPFVTRGVMG